jgi:galactose mutarotase-like enzyme
VEPALTLQAGDAHVVVDPADGGRVRSWVVRGQELLGARGRAPEEHGLYPMAPWPGRLRGNEVRHGGRHQLLPVTYQGWAMHGVVHRRRWEVIAASDGAVALRTSLGPDWPWSGQVTLHWALESKSLRSELIVSSDGEEFPAEAGWHPWFRRKLDHGGALVWRMAATALLERGPDGLPTGARRDPGEVPGPYDDVFAVPDGTVTLSWPGALTLRATAGVGWIVIYDERADLMCVEPQTAPPNGLGTSPPVRPDRPLRVRAAWSWGT